MKTKLKRLLPKHLKKRYGLSQLKMIAFITAFGCLGYFIWYSFAANPNLPGDINNDNTVDVTDLSILLSNYGTNNAADDLNGDSTVSIFDLSILLSHYGQTVATLPAPTNLAITDSSQQTQLTASWTAVGSAFGYRIGKDGVAITDTTQTTYTWTGLTCGTAYTLSVQSEKSSSDTTGGSANISGTTASCTGATPVPATGPLRVLASNPRYFTNDGTHAVYLVGSHNWGDLMDFGSIDPPLAFDYSGYINFMTSHGMNFMRMWAWDQTVDNCGGGTEYWSSLPWTRTGPGNAADGHAKFDLSQFNQAYFDRLRARVMQARDSGIYVSIMLFDGYGSQFCRTTPDGMPFDSANNINGINLAVPTDFMSLNNSAVTTIQDAYIKKVIDTVDDLDNVLYEPSNEAGSASTAWETHIISLVKSYESGKPKQHPVGMTFQYSGGSNSTLFSSSADWISPNSAATAPYDYNTNPPPADGSKVILSDTDHLCGECLDGPWVWRAFMRGDNVLYMDSLDANATKETARVAMGRTATLSRLINLAAMTPSTTISSTGYALVNPNNQYLVYTSSGGAFDVDLSAASGTFKVEWFNPSTGTMTAAAAVNGGANRSFMAPFGGAAAVYIYK